MPKTDFSRVENMLVEGLRRMNIDRLLSLADVASSIGGSIKLDSTDIALVKIHLNWHAKMDDQLFKKLGISPMATMKIVESKEKSEEEMATLQKIKEKVDDYIEEFEEDLPEDYNEKLVEIAREKSINQRFNVRTNWLPLH